MIIPESLSDSYTLERQPIGLNRGGLNEAAIAAEVADVGFEVM